MKTCPIKSLVVAAALFGFASSVSAASTWNAGDDFYANTITTNSTNNPNPTVPEWSYGYRSILASTNLTLYSAAQYQTNLTSVVGLSGFDYNSARVGVNVTGTNVTPSWATLPIPSHEVFVHPGAANEYAIVRWTAPLTDTYDISALWQNIDTHSGNGVTVHLVHNGTEIFNGSIAWNDTNLVTENITNLALNANDTLDFALGSNGSYTYDSTRFSATIQAIPEPSTAALLAVSGALALTVARRRLRKG